MADLALDARPTAPDAVVRRRLVASAVEGLDALYLAELAARPEVRQILHVASDGVHADHLAELIGFFAPGLEVVTLPAWDCLPYDRVSPSPDLMARRLEALGHLLETGSGRARLVITTANALLQKVPPPEAIRSGLFGARVGERIDRDQLLACLARTGYRRSGTVVEPGEFAAPA